MKNNLLPVLGLFLTQLVFAQTQTIKIALQESNKSPIIGATVKLVNRADSTSVQFGISDKTGQATFSTETGDQYLLTVTYTGMAPLEKGLTVTESNSLYKFVMSEDATALEAVTISAKKPLIRQEDDKTIVDPEPIANSCTNVYEVMEKTPGLFLDQDGNVYVSSTTPATIYINGREQKMSAEDIASMLKNLPPNSIEKIEILRTPSAKYDASGSGGIVNIVLKKGVKIGRTGSVNAGFSQGRYGNQNAGFTLNNSDGDRHSNLNLNLLNRNSYDQLLTTRAFAADSSLRQRAYTRTPGQSIYLGYSTGFEPDSTWSFDFDGRVNYGPGQSLTETSNQVLRPVDEIRLSESRNDLTNSNSNFSFNQGASTKYKIDTLGSEWTADLSYNFQRNTTNQDFTLSSLLPPSSSTVGGLGDIAGNRHYFAAQTDLKYKFAHKITLETGAKTSLQWFRNVAEYRVVVNGTENPDPFRTSTFNFNEYIHSAYLQASKGFGAFILKAGARLENTNMYGHQQVPADTSFSIRRTDLFPYVYFSRKVMTIAGYDLRGYLVFRKSITRPTYSTLNPFPKFLDQYLYESGNPNLKPEFTENYEFNISFNEMPIFAIGRNYVSDIFTSVVYENPDLPGVVYRTYDNLGKNEETYFKLVGALPPGGTYFFVVGAQYNQNKYSGLYQNKPLSFTRGSWSFFTYHQLKLGDRSMFTLNGFLRLKGQLQFYELSDFGGLSVSINRQFLNKKLTVTLSANDILYTNRTSFQLAQGGIVASGKRSGDTRRFGVNVRYSFGFKKREEGGNMFNVEGAGN